MPRTCPLTMGVSMPACSPRGGHLGCRPLAALAAVLLSAVTFHPIGLEGTSQRAQGFESLHAGLGSLKQILFKPSGGQGAATCTWEATPGCQTLGKGLHAPSLSFPVHHMVSGSPEGAEVVVKVGC